MLSLKICKYNLSYINNIIYPCTQIMIYPEERQAISRIEAKLTKIKESMVNIDDAKKCMFDSHYIYHKLPYTL